MDSMVGTICVRQQQIFDINWIVRMVFLHSSVILSTFMVVMKTGNENQRNAIWKPFELQAYFFKFRVVFVILMPIRSSPILVVEKITVTDPVRA